MPTPPAPDFRDPGFLREHVRHTLGFYAGRALDPSGGFFHSLADDGHVVDRRVRHLVSSTRFVFNHAMAWRCFGDPADQAAARHGLRFVQQAHAQPQGGYAWEIEWDGQAAQVRDGTQHAYGLAFVLLAHAHALMAGIEEAAEGLAATRQLMEMRFWEPAHGLYADEATPDWQLQPYRGQNANMHACEAMLAAHEATNDGIYLARALTLATSVAQRLASQMPEPGAGPGEPDGLVWEHFHPDWTPDRDYNRHDRTNIFRPWGFQTGHLTEWAKLLLQLEQRLPEDQRPDWILPTARRFFDAAMQHGWDRKHGGLFYGFAPGGEVCDADKYFWVQAESLAAAAWLAERTHQGGYWDWYDRIWANSWAHMIDHTHGAWYRIRKADHRPYDQLKSPPGKTDYHTMGACYDVLKALREAVPQRR